MDIALERALHSDIRSLTQEKERLESFQRLMINPDFRKVFLEYYAHSYAVSLVMLKANKSMTAEACKDNESKLEAIAYFSRFLNELQINADSVDERLSATETLRETI